MNETKLLVKKAQAHDLDAFEELVRIYQNKIYALCLQLSGSDSDAQDLAQEAFIRAFRALHSFRNEADFGTWLHRIAVNLWLNSRRKNSGKVFISLDEPYRDEEGGKAKREMPDMQADPQRILETKEFHGLVRTALQDLSEEHRAVLVLREMEGYSYEEVSQILDCSLGTVKSRLNRAREAMRRKMSELREKD